MCTFLCVIKLKCPNSFVRLRIIQDLLTSLHFGQELSDVKRGSRYVGRLIYVHCRRKWFKFSRHL